MYVYWLKTRSTTVVTVDKIKSRLVVPIPIQEPAPPDLPAPPV